MAEKNSLTLSSTDKRDEKLNSLDYEDELERYKSILGSFETSFEALLQEAKRGKNRAEQSGAMGWQKCELPKTNKQFLHNVVSSTIASNSKKMRLKQSEDKFEKPGTGCNKVRSPSPTEHHRYKHGRHRPHPHHPYARSRGNSEKKSHGQQIDKSRR